MRTRVLTSSNRKTRGKALVFCAAAITLLLWVLAAAFFLGKGRGYLVLENPKTGKIYQRFPAGIGDGFSVGFIHSINKSPVTDYYEIRSDGIYVVKTVYYGFGAGVQTELEEGQTLSYGEDGSMIITGFEKRIEDLIYFVGTVSDHVLTLPGKDGKATGESQVSLRDLCGRSAMVRFRFEPFSCPRLFGFSRQYLVAECEALTEP